MKSDGHSTPTPLTEPVPLPSLFVTGFQIQTVEENITRLIFWADLPPVAGSEPESRLQARMAMPVRTFRRLISEGRKALRGSN